MLWEIDLHGREGERDAAAAAVVADAHALGLAEGLRAAACHGYLVQGADLSSADAELLARELFADAVAERAVVAAVGDEALLAPPERLTKYLAAQPPTESELEVQADPIGDVHLVQAILKPGVMDPVAGSAETAARDLGVSVDAVRTIRKYWLAGVDAAAAERVAAKALANDAIERYVLGPLPFDRLESGSDYQFELKHVPLAGLDDDALMRLSREGQLYLQLAEMQTIQRYFAELGREPTDIELETLAQTWSEHCSHKTLAGRIAYRDEHGERQFDNMLKETIFAATQQLRQRWGDDDWCVSVFKDNAGIVRFDGDWNICFKVETHNHPSALEPYGGANTGLGGVIRDTLGTGLAAKPVANTDVFCFAPPGASADSLPPGVLHPKLVMRGVVEGVRDYGNRMGIPTVNGAVYFDERYLGNPLVYCGSVGLIPHDKSFKEPQPGDLIAAVGGRTGRDGIHGATFSSAELTHESESLSGGAVQIGNAIEEKKVADVVLAARDRGLFTAVTDCGAGGFSSAVGEMGEEIGAEVWLEKAPLKYAGLSYTEIWISEAQERMVLSVPEGNWQELHDLCAAEGVEATVIGRFKPTGRLVLKYHDQVVGDLAMDVLHNGRPPVVRQAVYEPRVAEPLQPLSEITSGSLPLAGKGAPSTGDPQSPEHRWYSSRSDGEGGEASLGTLRSGDIHAPAASPLPSPPHQGEGTESGFAASLLAILAAPNVASKEWIIRQYDHEVQGGSVVKPLVGVGEDGPGDAAVIRPVLESRRGVVISCGMNPRYGDLDTYHMAASAIDEAVRNCVAVGADPRRIAVLDNFCWGDCEKNETLGSLVRAAIACHDLALVLETPFISGKDSLNNEFSYVDDNGAKRTIAIPPSLLISAMGQVADVARCVTMDVKQPGNLLFVVGTTREELGGSHYALVNNLGGGAVPTVDGPRAKATFAAVHAAIDAGLVAACHDASEGGLAAAIAEMAFAGGFGADVDFDSIPAAGEVTSVGRLFSESNTRFVCEVNEANAAAFAEKLADIPHANIGVVGHDDRVRYRLNNDVVVEANLAELKNAWQTLLMT